MKKKSGEVYPFEFYTKLPNRVLQDNRLSWEALGLLTYLQSMPDGWVINVKHLMAQHVGTDSKKHKAGRDKMYRMINELKECGYLERTPVHGADGTIQWQQSWHIWELPVTAQPDTAQPDTAQPQRTHDPCSNAVALSSNTCKKGESQKAPPPPPTKEFTGGGGTLCFSFPPEQQDKSPQPQTGKAYDWTLPYVRAIGEEVAHNLLKRDFDQIKSNGYFYGFCKAMAVRFDVSPSIVQDQLDYARRKVAAQGAYELEILRHEFNLSGQLL